MSGSPPGHREPPSQALLCALSTQGSPQSCRSQATQTWLSAHSSRPRRQPSIPGGSRSLLPCWALTGPQSSARRWVGLLTPTSAAPKAE